MKSFFYTKAFLFIFCLMVNFSRTEAQETPQPNYDLAAKFSPTQLAKMVHSTEVSPHWLKNGLLYDVGLRSHNSIENH